MSRIGRNREVFVVVLRYGEGIWSSIRRSLRPRLLSFGAAPRGNFEGLGSTGIPLHGFRVPVKWFDETKGYGFIRPSDGGKDVFVHITAVRTAGLQTLAEGQKVNFDLVSERGKTAAGNLSLA